MSEQLGLAVEKRLNLDLTPQDLEGLPPEVLAELRPKKDRPIRRAVKARTAPELAQVFERAAWYLADFSDLYDDTIIQNDGTDHDADCIASRDEMRALSTRLRLMMPRQEITPERGAAEIIAGMLASWGKSGAVVFDASVRRFRLVGAGFEPTSREVCVGVYLPGVTAQMLEEDFAEVLASPNAALRGRSRLAG